VDSISFTLGSFRAALPRGEEAARPSLVIDNIIRAGRNLVETHYCVLLFSSMLEVKPWLSFSSAVHFGSHALAACAGGLVRR
jgi:hypothetical protein